ncbi:MAG: hypothetical protein LBT08_07405 [Synergistaceae bacterium]|jgi:hypothetical protein|nr:hypothetical protein [Synergistaceae bacterium]
MARRSLDEIMRLPASAQTRRPLDEIMLGQTDIATATLERPPLDEIMRSGAPAASPVKPAVTPAAPVAPVGAGIHPEALKALHERTAKAEQARESGKRAAYESAFGRYGRCANGRPFEK